MIELHDLTVRYDEATVLDVPSLSIPDGRLTALVGPNGAGKSTLLSVTGRLLKPTNGRALVGGLDVQHSPNVEISKVVSILRQENHLTARLTVADLVRFGRFPHCKGRLRPEDHRHVEEAIRFADLVDLRDRYLDQLSGGQRQRAFIAMVLAQDTPHILLDEPLNNLDIKHAVAMMQRLRSLVHDLGKTVVVVLHDINIAAAYCDQIIAMRDGRVLAQGSPELIIDPDVLREVYEVDVEVLEARGRRVAVYFE
ncbi:iron complex transport system ATP-binding protein [Yimella lutea]|uniref:Iron complex transport system ATP-binding protein n=1 Tax=Yimella lutea TaxID=587872 RepID=A0A542EFC3_9MICO|nr:ATP-binding cassette domain-containing protein [Yimella lutea]TQJ14037.1 iron complex transport system ATP-binding protein [Yimella lutea]